MQTIISALRQVIGTPDFYRSLTPNGNPTWDYAGMFEYFFACLLLLIVVSSVFRILSKLFD